MKKAGQIFSIFISVCLILGLAACGSNATRGPSSENGTDASMQESSTEPSSEVSVTDTETGVVVAYFSATGNTKAVAEQIAELTGGNLHEIVAADPYTEEDLDYGNDQSRTSQEMDDRQRGYCNGGIHYAVPGLSYLAWAGSPDYEHVCGTI